MYKAVLHLELGKESKEYMKILDKKIKFKRSNVKIKNLGGSLSIEINSDDLVSLFATTNSILKQLRIISSVGKLFS